MHFYKSAQLILKGNNMSDQPDITFTELGSLGLVTLNRPKALNAITHEMVLALYHQLGEWQVNADIKAILVQGAGEKAFCAGGDIRNIYEARNDPKLCIKQFFWDEYRLNQRIFHYPKPYIALLDGITMGGGVGISVHGSYRIATERFVFAMPETSIGFFPDVGGTYFLPRCPGETGTYLGLTGERIKTPDAAYLSLVNYYVLSENMTEMIDTLITDNFGNHVNEDIASRIKAAGANPGVPNLAEYRNDIDHCFKFDSVEEIISALQQRKNEWCDKTANLLLTKSPTSLKVTLAALRKGKQLNLDQCLQMEYRMDLRFLQGHDLYEGIRSVIIDKDQKPNWQPKDLEQISKQDVEAYFAPLHDTPELVFDK